MKAKAASNMAFIFVLVYVPYQVGILVMNNTATVAKIPTINPKSDA